MPRLDAVELFFSAKKNWAINELKRGYKMEVPIHGGKILQYILKEVHRFPTQYLHCLVLGVLQQLLLLIRNLQNQFLHLKWYTD